MLHVAHKNCNTSEVAGLSPVIQVLAYFSLFRYPLSVNEISSYLPYATTEHELRHEIDQLIIDGAVFSCGCYYSVLSDPDLAEQRNSSNFKAASLLEKAHRIGRFLSKFPFVTGVGISGSLSKNAATDNSDIDFFIITKANRLWIARTFLHFYKKLTFISGNQRFYCMNYFVDELALRIPERNIYTAIEIMTLVPVCGKGIKEFIEQNSWVSEWFDSYSRKNIVVSFPPKPFLSQILEKLTGNETLDDFLLRKTSARWERKTIRGRQNDDGKIMKMQVGRHFSRSDPGDFQQNLLSSYYLLLKRLSEVHPALSSAK